MHRRDSDLTRIARHRLTAIAPPPASTPEVPPRPDPARSSSPAAPPAPPLGPIPFPPLGSEPDHGSSPAPTTPWLSLDPPDAPGGWTPQPPPAGRPDSRLHAAPVAAGSPPPPGDAAASGRPDVAQPRTAAALAVVAAGYTAAHGDPIERVPVRRRRVRWAISWRLTAAAGAVVLLVAGAVALRATAAAPGEAVLLPTPAPSGLPAHAATPTTASGVVVDVVGAVAAPGVVRLAQGARVVDAIEAAGGATADAQVSALNLARVLVDGEQIAVPRPGEQPPAAASTAAGGGDDLIDLNAADATALDALPGIGPVLAERIVAHREDGPFTSVDELADVAGIGPTLLERLRDLVRV